MSDVHISLLDDASRNHGGSFRIASTEEHRDGVMAHLEHAGDAPKRMQDAMLILTKEAVLKLVAQALS